MEPICKPLAPYRATLFQQGNSSSEKSTIGCHIDASCNQWLEKADQTNFFLAQRSHSWSQFKTRTANWHVKWLSSVMCNKKYFISGECPSFLEESSNLQLILNVRLEVCKHEAWRAWIWSGFSRGCYYGQIPVAKMKLNNADPEKTGQNKWKEVRPSILWPRSFVYGSGWEGVGSIPGQVRL